MFASGFGLRRVAGGVAGLLIVEEGFSVVVAGLWW